VKISEEPVTRSADIDIRRHDTAATAGLGFADHVLDDFTFCRDVETDTADNPGRLSLSRCRHHGSFGEIHGLSLALAGARHSTGSTGLTHMGECKTLVRSEHVRI
jgi:hypothetical protein